MLRAIQSLPISGVKVLHSETVLAQIDQQFPQSLARLFEPLIRKSRNGMDCIYARGACDGKGQSMTFREAIRSWARIIAQLSV